MLFLKFYFMSWKMVSDHLKAIILESGEKNNDKEYY